MCLCVCVCVCVWMEETRKREESKSIDNVKYAEIEESKLNSGCNHALSSSDIMCSNAGAKKKAILTISPIKKPEMKRKPESGSLILFCEAPCAWCANAGPWCNCLPHMKLCNAEIFAKLHFLFACSLRKAFDEMLL